jgi:uncharacterized lipoprotein NlpE involved in copper resistance
MKKLLVALSVLVIASLTGCKGQAQGDYGNTEDYKLPNVTEILEPNNDIGYNYLIDNNTSVVYLEYQGVNGGHAITVMFNSDGTVMTEKDIKKE